MEINKCRGRIITTDEKTHTVQINHINQAGVFFNRSGRKQFIPIHRIYRIVFLNETKKT